MDKGLVGHTMADADGNLLAMDPGACEILQRDARELLGMSYTALTHPDDCARNIDLVQRLSAANGPMTMRKRYVRPDRSTVWADVQAWRLPRGADAGRLVGTIRMIPPESTERGAADLQRLAHRVLMLIQQRRAELGEDLFADNAWIILVQMYLGEAEGRAIDVAAIGERADVRVSIVARWLAAFESKGLVDRLGDEGAARLTPLGVARIEGLLGAMADD